MISGGVSVARGCTEPKAFQTSEVRGYAFYTNSLGRCGATGLCIIPSNDAEIDRASRSMMQQSFAIGFGDSAEYVLQNDLFERGVASQRNPSDGSWCVVDRIIGSRDRDLASG